MSDKALQAVLLLHLPWREAKAEGRELPRASRLLPAGAPRKAPSPSPLKLTAF